MEIKHIRIDSEEVISAKKEILHTQINMLNLVKRLRNYKILRRKEFTLRTKLKQEMSSLKLKTHLIISSLPTEVSKKEIIEVKKEIPIREKVNKDIQKELNEIKVKLAKLG